MPEPLLTKEQIQVALELLVVKLKTAQESARIYIVGGAALTLVYGARDATRDVDATFGQRERLAPFILEVADELELPGTWINDNVLMYIPPVRDDPNPVTIIDEGDVHVSVASTETLLAMKIRASRGRADKSDIDFLLKEVGVSSVQQAIDLYESYFPEDPLTERAVPILNELLGEN